MAEHAKFAPSSLSYFDQCPSFLNDDSESEAAESGTRCHKAMETDDDSLLDDEEQYKVRKCRELLAEVKEEFNYENRTDGFKETRLKILGDRCFGTVDFLELYEAVPKGTIQQANVIDRVALMLDWKFGRLPVKGPNDNLQMQAYVLGVFEKFPAVTMVHCGVIQPALSERKEFVFVRSKHYKHLQTRISHVLDRCESNSTLEFVPDCDVCVWCMNKMNCPPIVETVSNFTGIDIPAMKDATPETLGLMLDIRGMLRDYDKRITEFAKEKIREDGWIVPGYEITFRNPREKICNMIGVQLVLEDFDLPYDTEKLNLQFAIGTTDFKKHIKEHTPELSGKERKELLSEIRTELIKRNFIKFSKTDDEDGTPMLVKSKED